MLLRVIRYINCLFIVKTYKFLQTEIVFCDIFGSFNAYVAEMTVAAGIAVAVFFALRVADNKAIVCAVVAQPLVCLSFKESAVVDFLILAGIADGICQVNCQSCLVIGSAGGGKSLGDFPGIAC